MKKIHLKLQRLQPLFTNDEEFEEFKSRHEKEKIENKAIENYSGNAYLGIRFWFYYYKRWFLSLKRKRYFTHTILITKETL